MVAHHLTDYIFKELSIDAYIDVQATNTHTIHNSIMNTFIAL